MPTKFKPSETVVNKVRGQKMSTASPIKKYKHYYIKQTPKAELFEYINSTGVNMKPKLRIKCLNELVRRGVVIEWVDTLEGVR